MPIVRSLLDRFRAYLDLPDPDPIRADRGSDKTRYTGPFKLRGISPEDVSQGYISDCYLPAAVGSMAELMPDALDKVMKDNGDGSYTFTFREYSGGAWKRVPVKVDGDLYVNDAGSPRYGQTMGPLTRERMELWFPLLEKAYAQYQGSYAVLDQGGFSSDVLAALTGKRGRSLSVNPDRPDRLWKEITEAVDEGRAAALGTYSDGRKMKGSGLVDDHAYSLLGYEESDDGERYVKLRNPWGKTEPKGDDEDDGIFYMTVETAAKYFESFETIA